jgi:hypothetical protein
VLAGGSRNIDISGLNLPNNLSIRLLFGSVFLAELNSSDQSSEPLSRIFDEF